MYEYKELLRRGEAKSQTLEETVSALKSSLKQTKGTLEANAKKIVINGE